MINCIPMKGWNKCSIQGKNVRSCKSKPVFCVFTGDGKMKMSRLDSTCCAKHLPLAVRRAVLEERIYIGKSKRLKLEEE